MNLLIGISPILFGVIFVKSIFPKIHELEKICLGFLLGSGIFTLTLFLAGVGGKTVNLETGREILAIYIFLLTLFLVLSKGARRNFYTWVVKFEKLNRIGYLCGIVILVLFASSLVSNIYWPVNGWDALTLYDFRGKFVAETGNIGALFSIHRYYLSYPPYTSLVHTWIYLLGFNNPAFFYSLIYIAFVIVFYFNLTRLTNNKYAMVFTLLLAVSVEIFQHSFLAYTNLPYSVFIVVGFIYLFIWRTTKENNYLYLSAFLLGLSGWVRNSDPFWVAPLVVTFIYFAKQKKLASWFKFLLIVLLFRLPWGIYVSIISRGYAISSSNHLGNILNLGFDQLISRFALVTDFFWINVIKPNWIIIIGFLAGFLLVIKSKNEELKFFAWLIMFSLGIIFGGIYFYSLVYEKWQLVGNSVARMSMFLSPLVLFFNATLLYRYLTKLSER